MIQHLWRVASPDPHGLFARRDQCRIAVVKKNQPKKSQGYRVRLRPIALRTNSAGFLPQIDDDWIVESVDDAGSP